MVTVRRRGLALILAAASVSAGLPGKARGADAVLVRHEDVDADTEPEVILENRFLRVEVFTGKTAPPPGASLWRRVLGRPAPAPAPKYNCRFMGPGWIGNVVFKPTGRRWFSDAAMPTEAWRGIPEEFEEAVRVREVRPGVWRCLKIGVGVCEGRGWCTRDTLALLDPGRWESRTEETPGGGRALVFEQTLDAGDGYACRYRKRLALQPDESRLTVERELTNTGTRDLATTWYTHAFWGQGREGRFDRHCWATVPLRCGPAGTAFPELDTEPCRISDPGGTGYWGPLAGDLVGDAWYACGNSSSAEVFLTILPEVPAFYRVWTCAPTFSLEPFRVLRLASGQTERWTETLACGAGLGGIATHDGRAAYSVTVSPAAEGVPPRVELRGLPFEEVRDGRLRLEVETEDGACTGLDRAVPAAGPQAPISVCLDEWAGRLPLRLRVRLEGGGPPRAEAPGGRTGWVTVRVPPAESAELAPHAAGAQAVILVPAGPDSSGAPPPHRGAALLKEYLDAAGFLPVLRSDRDGIGPAGAAAPALVVCPGLRGLPAGLWRELERCVRAGSGLLVCGPIDPTAFEFTDLLPIRAAGAAVRCVGGPRDGTREFLGAHQRRYHLSAAGPHPVTDGLPWFPQAHQDIGVLQDLSPAPGAEVLLRYESPPGLLPEVKSPALVSWPYGQGRVAVLGSPVDWGEPAHWLLWSRVGEHHRRLFVRLALWTAAGAVPLPPSAPRSSECGSRASPE